MIDFIEATKFIGKDTISFQYLNQEAEYSDGWKHYTLEGCKKMQVKYNDNSGMLKIGGSVMYYAQGHNFTFNDSLFTQSIDHIGRLMKVSLWDMLLDQVEFGIIVKTPKPPKAYIKHHQPSKGLKMHEGKNKDLFRWYEDRLVSLKMYDAGRNIQHKQGLSMKGIIEGIGWNPSEYYLKFETHYKKPEISLNHGIGIPLGDLLNPDWKEVLNDDLIRQYERLIPMKTIRKPKDKSELHTLDIFARELVEARINEGISIQDVKKELYERINSSPLLSNADKDARKRQVKATFDKLEESEESEWDLEELMLEEMEG